MTRMKDSGIEWIGEVPEDWGIKKLSQFFSEHKLKNLGNIEQNLLSLSYGKIVRKSIKSSVGLLPESFETYNIIDSNDIVLRLTDLQNDKRSLRTGLANERGIITSAYLTIRLIDGNDSAKYYHYLLHSYDKCKVFYNFGGGVRQGGTWDDLSVLKMIAPPKDEQTKIADFLDKKVAQLDEVKSLLEEQIKTLEDYRQSLIYETVTKGLDKTVPLKDSGVDWIGQIPEGWNVDRLGFHIYEINEKNIPQKSDFILSLTNKDGVIPYEEKGNQGNNSKDNLLDYKLAYPDTIVANSMNILIGSVGYSNYFGCISPVYYVFKERKGTNLRFVNYIMATQLFQKELRKYANGILEIRLRVSSEDILKRFCAFPSLSDQDKIVSYLDKRTNQINQMIAIKKEQIENINKQRQTLIYDYVTGKRRV
ncbi:restriction endonuclease subunit S [Streptococcus parasuis]|uniref:restriction endonuclease subunit S n=1 Tax=Streptococcus parasuis TaxID=1501662 RepID=UPI0025A564CB|nr:restriction endonuclease subunit S [Streptococcus parasuis]WJQ85169.1 restriction endonuclease subunit S [Streptococcus parasuis]